MPTPSRISACFAIFGVNCFSTAVRAGVLLDIAQQNLGQAGRVVQEVRFAIGTGRHLFQKRAVHVLPQADGGNGDVVGERRLGELEAVAFLGMPSVRSTMCL